MTQIQVACLFVAVLASLTKDAYAKSCYGCSFRDECLGDGESRPYAQCMVFKCYKSPNNAFKQKIEWTGCRFGDSCVPPGESRPTDKMCQEFQCERNALGSLTSKYAYTGCNYNGHCVAIGESEPTGQQCQQVRCEKNGRTISMITESSGCPYKDQCVAPGQTIDADRPCKKFSCTRHDGGLRSHTFFSGCSYKGECVPAGEERDTDENCKVFVCKRRNGNMVSSYEYTGCDLNGVCIPQGSTVDTDEICKKFECHGDRHNCGSSTFYVGCAYRGECVDPGTSIPTGVPCQQFSCTDNEGRFLSRTEYTGCYDDGVCHDIGGENWDVRKRGACITKSCERNGLTVSTKIVTMECEVTDSNGNKVCLGDGDVMDNGCEQITCEVTVYPNGTFSARKVVRRNGCMNDEGECVPLGETWVDKSGRMCITRVCGVDMPTKYECKSRDNQCHAIGSDVYGEYMRDGQCRSRRCKPHFLLKAVSADVGQACSFSEGGCRAPGQPFTQVSWAACRERECFWRTRFGARLARKRSRIVGCSDAAGDCHPVPSFPIDKRSGGVLYGNVRCAWANLAQTRISYLVRPAP